MLAQVIKSRHQRLSCKVCPSHLGTPSAAPTGCQLGIGPQVSQSRALLATSSLQRRPLEPSMLIVYLGGACSPPEAGGVSMINCTGGCPSMAKRYRWFATSPGSVTGPDTTSSRGITKREPPPCSSVTGVTTPTRDTIAFASQVPHASVRNGAPTRHLAPLPRALVSHLPCQVWPTRPHTHKMSGSAQTNWFLGMLAPTPDNCTRPARRHASGTLGGTGCPRLTIAQWPLALLLAALTSGSTASLGGRSAR